VSAARLARVLEASPGEVESALADLTQEYAEAERGFQLREVAGGWRLYTHPAHHDMIESYVLSWDTRRLSQAALEALSVIAYHQPVTRAGVNAVRGVKEAGRDSNQGNAILYATTRTFLEKFGLKDISGLPPLEAFAPDEDTERAIRDRLSATDGPSMETTDADDDEIAEVD
jgi:segregation and condensation protein B